MMETVEECSSCRYWVIHRFSQETGECRRFPAAVATSSSYWCGEYDSPEVKITYIPPEPAAEVVYLVQKDTATKVSEK